MSDKLDRKEEAAGLQYIKRFLVPMVASEWDENWQPKAQEMLKSIHRIDADAPILGKDMTDLLFYRAIIETPGYYRNRTAKREIIFRIGKYANRPVVSYYSDKGESKWYRTNETPDQAAIHRIMESFGWEGKDENPVPGITKIEEAEALQFIRNVAIPYSIDHIYNVFLTMNARAPNENFSRIGYDDLRNNLKKWQQNSPNNIVYLVEFGKDPRAYFKYYIQKVSGVFGIRVMIHNQLPMPHSSKTNDVVLYIGKGKQPSWFQKLGYMNETLMGPGERSDVTKREELQAIQWIRNYLFTYLAKELGASEEHLRSTFRKTRHDNDIFYHSKTGIKNYEDVDFIIYKDDKNRIIIGVDNGPGWHIDFPVGERQYLAHFDPADHGSIHENELLSDPKYDINKKEEAQALQYIRSLIPKVADELNLYIASGASGIKFHVSRLTGAESITRNLKKTEHRKQIFSSKRGPQDYIEYTSKEIGRPSVVFYIYKTEKQRGDPESGVKIGVGYKNFNPHVTGGTTSYLTENDGGKYDNETDDAYINRMVKISPREEAEGLFYIKKFLFEKASNFWGAIMAASAKHSSHISSKEIAKNFKKVAVKRIPPEKQMERHAHERIDYISSNRGVIFKFYTSKDGDGNLYVGFVPPGRDDAGMCYGLDKLRTPPHLQESLKHPHRISKMEEAEALQYIRRVLGPAAVEAWNQRTMQHQFKPEEILGQLKKIVDNRPPDDISTAVINTDYIQYSVTIPVRDVTLDHKVFFTFAIYKNKDGELVINYYTPLIDGGPYVVGSSPFTGRPRIREEVDDDPNPNPHKTITKMDELRAVDFIKKLIVPLAVKRWNRLYKPHGDMSADEVRRTMRKTEHNAWPRIISDFVVYMAPSKVGHKFHFEIWKDSNGMLMVGWKMDNETNLWGTYFVGDPSPVDEAVHPNIADREVYLIQQHAISRKDEAQAANFIIRELIPKIVIWVNDESKHWTGHDKVTLPDVLKTFKKVAAWDSKFGYRRELQYQALFLGEPFLFDIFKDNGKLIVLQKSDGTQHRVR